MWKVERMRKKHLISLTMRAHHHQWYDEYNTHLCDWEYCPLIK